MLKRATIIIFLLLTAAPLTAMSSTEPLEVILTNPTSQDKAESAFITITVTNRSDRPLLLPKGDSALDSDHGNMWNNVVTIVSQQGQPVAYRGRSTRVATRERDVRFWTIEPGQVMTSEVDLAANYDIQDGAYKVSYKQYYIEIEAWNPDEVSYQAAHSNVLDIYANSSLLGRYRALRQASLMGVPPSSRLQTTGPDSTCNGEQATAINNARNTASSWAFFAKSASGDLYKVKHSVDSNGRSLWTPSIDSNALYTTWFGAPENTSSSFTDVPRLQQVWDEGDFFPLHVTSAINARVNVADSYSCGCSADAEARGAAAWTEESGSHMCSLFFRLPFSTYGIDNQVIVVLHENAHHSDAYGPFIGDYPLAYGRSNAKAFALADRTNAMKNADNYAYYAEAVRMSKDKNAAAPNWASLMAVGQSQTGL